MMMKHITLVMVALCLTSGCATMKESLVLGAGSGMATGAVVGAIASSENSGQGALIGGAIGAAIGGLAALFIQNGIEDRDSKVRKETLFSLEKFGVSEVPRQGSSVPAVSFPVVDEQKIETHREGNKVVEGHHVWFLGDDSNLQFVQPNDQKRKKQ